MRLGLALLMLVGPVLAACAGGAPLAADASAVETDVVEPPDVMTEQDVARDAGVDVDPAVTRGAVVFRTFCATCHGARGAGTGDGPDLRIEVPTVTDEQVLRLVRDGGVRMPPIEVDDDQRADVLVYLRATFGSYRAP